jgi:hypothetical protein
MKRCRKLRCAAFALPLLLATAAPAATVVWGAVTLGPSYWPPSTHILASEISPGGGAGILLEIVRGPRLKASLQATDMTIGIRHWWFETQYGAALDASAMVDADYLVNTDPMELGSIEMPYNRIFYLGFRLAGGGADYTKYIYGWASLLWNGTDLVLVDSAAETTGAGIYAGTYNAIPVPEPSVAGLLLVGAGVVLLHRRKATAARRRSLP